MTRRNLVGAYYSTAGANEIVLVDGHDMEMVITNRAHYERLVRELRRLAEALGWDRDAEQEARERPEEPDGIALRSASHLDTEDAREWTRHEARCAALRAAVHLVGPGRTGRDMLHVAELFEHWLMRPRASQAEAQQQMNRAQCEREEP